MKAVGGKLCQIEFSGYSDTKVSKTFNQSGVVAKRHFHRGTYATNALKTGIAMTKSQMKADRIDNALVLIFTDGDWHMRDTKKVHALLNDKTMKNIDNCLINCSGHDHDAKMIFRKYFSIKEIGNMVGVVKSILLDKQIKVLQRYGGNRK